MAMDPALISAALITKGVLDATSVGLKAYNDYQSAEVERQQNLYNAKMSEYDAQLARSEYAMNAGLLRESTRREIASAENIMSATGNIGPSADAVVIDSYFNLGKDLSSMKYQYDNTAINALNRAKNYRYNAEVARKNKTSAIIGGVIDVPVSIAGNVLGAYNLGLIK